MKLLGRNLLALVLLLAIGCQLAPAMRPFVMVEELVHQASETVESATVHVRRQPLPTKHRKLARRAPAPDQARPVLHLPDLAHQIETLPLSRRGPPA